MNENARENSSAGRLASTAKGSVVPGAVNCTKWDAEIPAEHWSSGKLVRATHPQAPAATSFTSAESLELEITLQIEPVVHPARAFAIATQMVAELFSCDPGIGLTYDPARSVAEEGKVVIVLTPLRQEPDTKARLEKIAKEIRITASEAGGIALNGVRILRAA